jgi:hypothetical protein
MRRSLARAAKAVLWLCGALALGVAPPAAAALPLVQVGNGPQQPDGSYINAINLAQNLFFIAVPITAETEIRYAEAVDIGTTTFGPNNRDITHTAPLVTILGDVRIGNAGFFNVGASLALSGSIREIGGALVTNPLRVSGDAASVSVDSHAASLQQALLFTRTSAGVSAVTATHGSAAGLAFDYDTEMILSGGQLSGSVAMNHAASRLEIHGRGFRLDGGSGFAAAGSGPVTPLAGQLEGTLDSGDDFLVSFTQGAPGQIELVSSSEVPLPWAVRWVAAATLLVLGAYALRPQPARR